jgi:hypothetical protein
MATDIDKAWNAAKGFVERFLLPEPTRGSAKRSLVAACVALAFLLLVLLASISEGEDVGPFWWAMAATAAYYFLTWFGMLVYERYKTLSALLRLAAIVGLFLFIVYVALLVTDTL